ncbi:TraB/GumN family protein [Miniphocaeibacter massiliensis]|uniref:TraB/GumN family protein n=1 Tax=Miniphocaeibacter massiliensis TaxID=2041841 RepID=UPI000C1BB47F|nr:TraB/GumN family protein [Miniphocaeibacter massiliensis]
MKKKKISLLIIAMLISLLAIVGCSKDNKKETTAKDTTVTTESTNAEKEQLNVKWPYYEIKKDGAVKGHIIGTIHMGKEEMYPFPQEMLDALNNSKYFVTEVKMAEMSSPESQEIMLNAMKGDKPLTDEMDEDTKKKYLEVLKDYGVGEEMVKTFNRFGVSQTLTAKTTDPTAALFGVDMQLTSANKVENIGLETIQFQFDTLSKLADDPSDIKEWVNNIPTKEKAIEDFNSLLQNYIDGNILGKYETPKSLDVSQEYYDALLTNRNKNWIEQLPKYLESENNSFIAVGAGHLPGDNGVLKLLEEKGYETNLIEFK